MDTPTKTRRFPWLKLVLVISLVMNFVALGMIWGVASRAGPSGSLLRASVAALPAPERRALQRETGAIWREARANMRHTPAAPQAMIAALQAEEFDAAAFSASLRQAQERLVRISDQMHDQLLDRVSAMSLEERRAYAEALADRLGKRRWQPQNRWRAQD
ncbi:MAG: periplasmic heavy metal sensor [Rhodobacteraceae bacterium]|nr:periplasmic heavy metal sensor [Paracoccaceae bacterium]